MDNEIYKIIKEKTEKAESKLYAQIDEILSIWKEESKRNLEEQIKFINENVNIINRTTDRQNELINNLVKKIESWDNIVSKVRILIFAIGGFLIVNFLTLIILIVLFLTK